MLEELLPTRWVVQAVTPAGLIRPIVSPSQISMRSCAWRNAYAPMALVTSTVWIGGPRPWDFQRVAIDNTGLPGEVIGRCRRRYRRDIFGRRLSSGCDSHRSGTTHPKNEAGLTLTFRSVAHEKHCGRWRRWWRPTNCSGGSMLRFYPASRPPTGTGSVTILVARSIGIVSAAISSVSSSCGCSH